MPASVVLLLRGGERRLSESKQASENSVAEKSVALRTGNKKPLHEETFTKRSSVSSSVLFRETRQRHTPRDSPREISPGDCVVSSAGNDRGDPNTRYTLHVTPYRVIENADEREFSRDVTVN